MTVQDIVNKLNLTVFCGREGLSAQVTGGYTSDLLSDVMGHADAGRIWITLQAHKNVMAIASLKELAAIVLIKGIAPDGDTIALSDSEGIPVLGSSLGAFELSGELYGLINN
ncbi:MAG: serine kinase [Tannerella sp.]|jgi:predicted transcriptional regulator|nr:serine kinase [Tannerella sp.]